MFRQIRVFQERRKAKKKYWEQWKQRNNWCADLCKRYEEINVNEVEDLVDIVNNDGEFASFVSPLVAQSQSQLFYRQTSVCSFFKFGDMFDSKKRRELDRYKGPFFYDTSCGLYVYDHDSVGRKLKRGEYRLTDDPVLHSEAYIEFINKRNQLLEEFLSKIKIRKGDLEKVSRGYEKEIKELEEAYRDVLEKAKKVYEIQHKEYSEFLSRHKIPINGKNVREYLPRMRVQELKEGLLNYIISACRPGLPEEPH